jgi:TetR/AcrR family transcriptional repressor of nem operon
MGRPKSYEEGKVVAAAKSMFWRDGYEHSSLEALERATGLSRSSIYHAFDGKRGLFDAAVEDYLETVTSDVLRPADASGSGLEGIVEVFRLLAVRFRKPGSRRGCLMINSIAELSGRDATFARPASDYMERVKAAFSGAMGNAVARGAITPRRADERVEMLTATLMGAWVAVRIDPEAAAKMCDATARQVASWAP